MIIECGFPECHNSEIAHHVAGWSRILGPHWVEAELRFKHKGSGISGNVTNNHQGDLVEEIWIREVFWRLIKNWAFDCRLTYHIRSKIATISLQRGTFLSTGMAGANVVADVRHESVSLSSDCEFVCSFNIAETVYQCHAVDQLDIIRPWQFFGSNSILLHTDSDSMSAVRLFRNVTTSDH
jgi:hypothetical protein